MSTPKPAKTKDSDSVKFSNKTGGAYAEMKKVIQSERESWKKPANGRTDLKQGSTKKQ
jgi:hypothetical protein